MESVEVFGNTIYETTSRREDLIWVMSRFQSVEISKDQKVAGWAGFHQQVSSPERKDEVSKVIYLPSIGESPTKVSTVQEVLQQVKAKAESIGLKEGDLVLNHAIYEVAFLLQSLENDLLLACKISGPATLGGGGHAPPPPPPTFLRSKKKKGKQRKARKTFKAETIKRLPLRLKLYCLNHSRASRIQKFFSLVNHGDRPYFSVFHGPRTWRSISPALELCIEVDLVGTTSAEKIMKGKQYNRVVRSLKVVYEAFQQIKLNPFIATLIC